MELTGSTDLVTNLDEQAWEERRLELMSAVTSSTSSDFVVAAAKDLHQAAVFLINLQQVFAVMQGGVPEVAPDARHERLPKR